MRSFVQLIPAAIVAAFAASPCLAAALAVMSPDERIKIELAVDDSGVPRYAVSYRGNLAVMPSRLGFTTEQGDLTNGFAVAGDPHPRSHDASWRPVYGEREEIPDRWREMAIELKHTATGIPLRIVLRAYNEGAALRCVFPRHDGTTEITVKTEHTEFRFPSGSSAYAEYGPEGVYQRVPIEAIKPDCEHPLTVTLPDGDWLALVEAGLDRYPRMRLAPFPAERGSLVSTLQGPVTIALPGATPWRAFILGTRPGALLENNHLVYNLNPPCALANPSWIKPGKVIRDVTLSTPGGKACVDFAAAQGLSYVLYDAGWYGSETDDRSDARAVSLDPQRVKAADHPGLDLPEVIAYAKSKGVGIILYVNRRALERQRDEIFPLYRKWGVAGVKFGFVQVGPERWTTWLLESVRRAAEHKLVVAIHDHYRPSGFSRTYPNLLTQEGVRGNEHMPSAAHNATLPFVRLPAGAADATICYFTPRIRTTRAHQLALAVIIYSPLQHLYWYDRPTDHRGEPETAFFARVPTTWHETRVLHDRIGELASLARRSGRDWFVGTICGDAPVDATIPLSFLVPGQNYRAHIYEGGDGKTAVNLRTENVNSASRLPFKQHAAGGQAIWIEHIDAKAN